MNIGDYVRVEIEGLSIQRICKIIKIVSDEFFYIDIGYFDKENIIKSSPNIIDLIEVGDILKFKNMKHYQEVLAIDNEKLYLTGYIYMSGLQEYKKEIEEDLEWVITHEQIEQMAYKIG